MSASSPSTTRCSLFPFSFSPTVNSKRLPPADIITGVRRSTWSVHWLRLRLLPVTISGDVTNPKAATFRFPLRKLPPPEAVAIWAPVESLRPRALFAFKCGSGPCFLGSNLLLYLGYSNIMPS